MTPAPAPPAEPLDGGAETAVVPERAVCATVAVEPPLALPDETSAEYCQ